jgi:hypothetical protein
MLEPCEAIENDSTEGGPHLSQQLKEESSQQTKGRSGKQGDEDRKEEAEEGVDMEAAFEMTVVSLEEYLAPKTMMGD